MILFWKVHVFSLGPEKHWLRGYACPFLADGWVSSSSPCADYEQLLGFHCVLRL